MGLSNRDRALQVGRCLAVKFPAPYPVNIRIVKKLAALPGSTRMQQRTGDHGETYWEGRKITILLVINPCVRWAQILDTLLHEWAHATVTFNEVSPHDDEWALMYGQIYRWFVDEGGDAISKTF